MYINISVQNRFNRVIKASSVINNSPHSSHTKLKLDLPGTDDLEATGVIFPIPGVNDVWLASPPRSPLCQRFVGELLWWGGNKSRV